MAARPGVVAAGLLLGLTATAPGRAGAQQPVPDADRCFILVDNVDRTGSRIQTSAGEDYYAGGNVRLRCRGLGITMASDSIAAYAGRVVQFLGSVRYRDSTLALDSDHAIYHREGERFEARGRVRTRNLETGSTLEGPSLDYFRRVRGLRDTTAMVAVGRPTIRYVDRDAAARDSAAREPYVIVGDRVRLAGDDRLWAGGRVTVDRSDLHAEADSLRLDTGDGDDATLVGGAPRLEGKGAQPFTLTGTRIDLALDGRDVRRVVAAGAARLVATGRDVAGDTVVMELAGRTLQRTFAWGGPRATARSEGYDILADSLSLETPGGRLAEVRAFGDAWVGAEADSADGERDWVQGDTVLARFRPRAADTAQVVLATLDAAGDARTFYRNRDRQRPDRPPTLGYARGLAIRILMQPGDSTAVERVDVRGQVEGVQLEPGAPRAASGGGGAAPRAPAGPP